ncbi:YkgJ family cysteine cluster protein [Candidatus Woesearchaeota archaeon]|nr:YkgJ family cysteine cluster protein [Candidatus Woesearchaeota archaeon]
MATYVEDLNKCMACGAECCRSLAIEIDAPEDLDDFEDLKWYIYHKGLTVYLDTDGVWNVEIPTKCVHLDREGKCLIYKDRPPVCREFDVVDCNDGDDRSVWFKTAEDVDKYVAELKKQGKLKPGKVFK